MLGKFVVSLSILCLLSGVRLVQAEEEMETSSEMIKIEEGMETSREDLRKSRKDIEIFSGEKNKKHYTFRIGKIRMKDTHNSPSISREIRDAYLIRFLIPSRDVNEEHSFYSFNRGFGNWCKDHFDLHIGITKQGNPFLYLIGGNFEITNFVDMVGGIAFSNDLGYRDQMYYFGITFDSQLFHHIIDMIQQGIQWAEK